MRSERAQGDVAQGGRPAFTLIELLVVIVIIGLLIATIGLVGSRVVRSQREKATQNYMRAITAAIDQFAQTNPLRLTYDTKRARSFGPYPPYRVQKRVQTKDVADVLGPAATVALPTRLLGGGDWPGDLRDGSIWGLRDEYQLPPSEPHNDIRALYIYLRVFGDGVLSQVPERALAPLGQPGSEWVQPSSSPDSRFDVLGFHDVWGVPLDYLLYVKLEYKLDHTGMKGWRVTDRRPVLRSRGVPKEVADAGADTRDDWIFSTPLPSPVAAAVNRATGEIDSSEPAPRRGGWVRAVGAGDLNPGDPETRLFGFVP